MRNIESYDNIYHNKIKNLSKLQLNSELFIDIIEINIRSLYIMNKSRTILLHSKLHIESITLFFIVVRNKILFLYDCYTNLRGEYQALVLH